MTVLKSDIETLDQLRHVSVLSHKLHGAQYPCLLKLLFVKIISYGKSVCDYISGDVAVYIVHLEKLTVVVFQHSTCIILPEHNFSMF